MRRAAVLAVALALVPLPAAADVTARYDLGREALTVEVDEGGDYRAEVAGKVMLLRRGGVDYVVIFQGTTPLVVERQAFLALATNKVSGMFPKSAGERRDMLVASAGEETVAGRRGTLWTIRAEKPGGKAIQAVMSADRDLAPVGAVFASVLDAGLQTFGALLPDSNLAERIREVMAKGAPLRLVLMEELQLRSVSKAEIDAARFALPGPVMDASAFDQAMSAATTTTTVTVPPPPPLP
ncbi:hypothetical protein [Sphingomonas psychrotolerans]|uniref:DUF4412 domain-containing protein n=1 Tax=Sphingomonas psychrotolerans TaxID=1327635 RepID=A0A2K8MIW4_9SPHN|nr:hypothetical protein [Sphingomonas psychrotolerans]ATY33828.1 hypothetical protein CVN68_19235 [Sphingomonas psychrotolerans]